MARFTTRSFAATALAAAMLAAAAVPAMAQNAPAPQAQAPAATATKEFKPGQRAQERQRMTPEQRQARMAQRAEAFKQKLQITPAQESAWTNFQASMQAGKGEPRQPRMNRQEMQNLTAPERVDRMRAMHQERAAEMDRRGEAVKTFYAALSPEQQKVFDQESARMMQRHGKGKHHGPHHGGKRGGPQGGPMAPAAPAAPVQPQ